MEKTRRLEKSSGLIEILKATIFALIISMVLIIVFAIIIRFVNISDNIIMPVNQIIKGVSILLACIITLRGSKKGLIKGIIIGVLYSILSYIVFSVLSSTMTIGLTTITDLLFSAIIGGISGLVAVNIKKGSV